MQILRQGYIKAPDPNLEFECDNCGCEFIAERREVEYSEEVSWGPDHNEYRCNCPCCGEECSNRIY